jgi:hypothetical protein
MDKIENITEIGILRDKINEIIEILNKSVAVNVAVGDLSTIKNLNNGWYQWTGTLAGVSGTWIITKASTVYTAINTSDVKIVFNSNDLTNWYSPYGSWHV